MSNNIVEKFSHILLILPHRIWNLLGFDAQKAKVTQIAFFQHHFKQSVNRQKMENLTVLLKSDTPYGLTGCVRALYVYTDIIKPSSVGDSYSHLLRICEFPSKAKFGEQIIVKYNSLNYFPLSSNEIEYIEIDIKDDTGENIKFEYERLIGTLEFKK